MSWFKTKKIWKVPIFCSFYLRLLHFLMSHHFFFCVPCVFAKYHLTECHFVRPYHLQELSLPRTIENILTYIGLVSVFRLTDGTARILPWFLSFYLPSDKYSRWSTQWQALRERECTWWGTQEDRSTINFGCVQVQTPAACAAGKCFIHCAMPLGLEDILTKAENY